MGGADLQEGRWGAGSQSPVKTGLTAGDNLRPRCRPRNRPCSLGPSERLLFPSPIPTPHFKAIMGGQRELGPPSWRSLLFQQARYPALIWGPSFANPRKPFMSPSETWFPSGGPAPSPASPQGALRKTRPGPACLPPAADLWGGEAIGDLGASWGAGVLGPTSHHIQV